MRSLLNKTLVELAKTNDRIYMVLADIGYGEVEEFAKLFPDRFFNVGVAEQNMTGIACGLALEGFYYLVVEAVLAALGFGEFFLDVLDLWQHRV